MSLTATPGRMLAGVLEPLSRALTPATARALLSVQADEAAQRRIGELAQRCDQGLLTPEEQAEYQLFVEVGDCVALLQTRARRFLAESAGQ